jgi:hypothetical protein
MGRPAQLRPQETTVLISISCPDSPAPDEPVKPAEQLTPDPMTPNCADAVVLDFTEACVRFTEASRQQQAKDTPAYRTAVLKGRARIDAILDIHLGMQAGFPGS